jgi:hypothetical protein
MDDDDVDRYFDTAPVVSVLNPVEDQAAWILAWWAANHHGYPRPFMTAREYLAIPASEVDIEHLFGLGRDMLGIRRYAMKGATMSALMLLKVSLSRSMEGY